MLDISRQAKTYLWIWIITSVINAIVSIFGVFGVYSFLSYLLFMVLSTPFILLYIYNIDCLTYGNCNAWSWFITIMSSLSLIFLTIMMILVAVTSRQFASSINDIIQKGNNESVISDTSKDSK